MKERPILFSGAMVRALLDGRKTQTRRIVKPTMTAPRMPPLTMEPWIIDGEQETDDNGLPCWAGFHPDYPGEAKWFTCPYGRPGDRLWVRETWNCIDTGRATQRQDWVRYRATDGDELHWRPSIFMPRWASRITLEIADVRVERVQDISEADAVAEGVEPIQLHPDDPANIDAARAAFADLWDTINAAHAPWSSNPWVWVVEFTRVEAQHGS